MNLQENIRRILREETIVKLNKQNVIKNNDEFINEDLDWNNIKTKILKTLETFKGDIKEVKRVVKDLLRKGVLPLIIVGFLGYYFSESESNSILKEVMEEHDDGYDIINKEINDAKSIVFKKISTYKDKDIIIKKLNDIEIIVSDLDNYNSLAQFTINKETKEVCILIDKKHILTSNKKDIIESLTHEMLHYVDYMIGFWSLNNKEITNNSVDVRVKSDKKYATDKIFYILYNHNYESLVNNPHFDKQRVNKMKSIYKDIEKNLLIDMLNDYNYYTSTEEIFVRVNLLRNFMISKGIIKDFNENLTREHFKMAIDKLDRKNGKLKSTMKDYLRILFLIDFDSDSINKIVKLNVKNDSNLT